MAKKKKPQAVASGTAISTNTATSLPPSVMETILQVSEVASEGPSISTKPSSLEQVPAVPDSTEKARNAPPFKNPNWIAKTSVTGRRSRVWKSLKQITTSERQIHGHNATLYSSLDAPPSTRCSKKYSDISGLPAKYTDPLTKLKYSNTKEFRKLRSLAPEIVQGYLSLRKAEVLTQL